jgi:hypothetical protein
MRYRPVRYQTIYHRARADVQHRKRWLLYLASALLLLNISRCAMSC